jgi:TfoX/Sxy family transcriptional regulator of competence genes
MSTIENRLRLRLMPLGAEPRKMFGGTCFMLNGNMVCGTFKGELLARVDPARDGESAKRKGAHPMKMGDRTAAGYWMIPEAALAGDSEFDFWTEAALAFNRTLPAKAARNSAPGKARNADKRARGK